MDFIHNPIFNKEEFDSNSSNLSNISELQQNRKIVEENEFFFSPSLGQYVSRKPLSVDDRVVSAAEKLGIHLSWDDKGRICDISLVDAKNLMTALGSSLLSPSEYWKTLNDAQHAKDHLMLKSMQSNEFAEWLDVAFKRDTNGLVQMIEHPDFINGELEYDNPNWTTINQPCGRPGWFNPALGVDPKTAMPNFVKEESSKNTLDWTGQTWKYWSTFRTDRSVGAIRGYVISSGTPSFDCDIPWTAHQDALMIREVRSEELTRPLSKDLVDLADSIYKYYETTLAMKAGEKNNQAQEDFFSKREFIFQFIRDNFAELNSTDHSSAFKIKEQLIDALGAIRLEGETIGDIDTLNTCKEISSLICGQNKQFRWSELLEFVKTRYESIDKARSTGKPIIFVMGHENPDTDTVIASLFEAYRNSLIDSKQEYIPILQAKTMPDEIRALVGDELSDSMMTFENPQYRSELQRGVARWILVDHNVSPQQKYARSIIDHHVMSDTAKCLSISRTSEMIGSCASQVGMKILGSGCELDSQASTILLGAALMDTENRSSHKMTSRDIRIMDLLTKNSEIQSESLQYQRLMSALLNTNDSEVLFGRDYKQDWGLLGFAVIKVTGVLSKDGEVLKPQLIKDLLEFGYKNNARQNLAVTMIKIVDYDLDNENVNRERLYLCFGPHATLEFKEDLFSCVQEVVKLQLGKRVQVSRIDDGIEYWGVGDQLSRKISAPIFAEVVALHNSFCFISSVGKWVSREFLTLTEEVQGIANKLQISLSADDKGRVRNVTYREAKLIAQELGAEILSLPEYWKVLKESKDINDEQLQKHLISQDFVEFLDTVIIDGSNVMHHPVAIKKDGDIKLEGNLDKISVPIAKPGLILEANIEPRNGFPEIVESPMQYGNPDHWRYWSPDSNSAVATRGSIFLLGKPALDLKVTTEDALPNLGIRLCFNDAPILSRANETS